MKNIPYTYLIGWSNLNIWYYGVRYAETCHPKDLWSPYKTSSKYVKDCIVINGEPDVIEIRRTFANATSAKNWEDCVLRRMKAVYNPNWLNKANLNSFKSVVMTEEIKSNISKKAIQRNTKGKFKVITDGVNQTRILKTEELPVGWKYGISDKNAEIHLNIDHNAFKNKTEAEIKEIGNKISGKIKGKSKPLGHGANVSKASKGKSKPWQVGENNVSKRQEVKNKISKSWETREIGTWYTDECSNYYVKSGDYVDSMWRRGKLKTDKKWFNDGKNNYFVFPKTADVNWLAGKTKTGKVWYTDGVFSKKFIEDTEPSGWTRGRTFSEEGRQNMITANKKPKSEEHKRKLSMSKKKNNV